MKSKKIISAIVAASMFLVSIGKPIVVSAKSTGVFDNALPTIQRKAYSKEKFTAKPLIILMDFPDYKHEELDTREDWRINNFKGSECTPEFYEKLFFGDDYYTTSDSKKHITVNKFFKEESGGTYEFKGKVVGWYMADHNAAYYGKSQSTARELVKEAVEKASKNLDLSQFDIEDKWDINGNGNFHESNGVLDTVVVIHPGLGEEWGGGSLGENAIWPFRWGFNVFGENMEKLTPKERKEIVAKNPTVKDKNGKEFKIEDFTVFEQDLPVDLFNHEYGHVLGLPDLYGTDGESTPPVENWSIMGGSYSGNPRGSEPVSYGAYCKEYLQKDFEKRGRVTNWQNAKKLHLDKIDEEGLDIILDQASLKGNNNDAIRIDLPKYDGGITKPVQGKYSYFSGKGNNLENYMTSKESIDLTKANSAELTFKTWYNIDPGFDFASVQVREDGSKDWIAVKGNITTDKVDQWIVDNDAASIKERNPGHGITNSSNGKWIDAKFDLSKFKGKKIDLRFRFRTDENTPEDGIYIDDLKITADKKIIFKDDAEGEPKFDFKGFSKSDIVELFDHYYLLEWRNSGAGTLVDKGLSTINIGRPGLQYDPGLVIWYINEKYNGFKPDQNTKGHLGELFAGVVDANQNPVIYKYKNSGSTGADRINFQMHDAAFSLRPGSKINITGQTTNDSYIVEDSNTFMVPVFSDSNDYTASSYNSQCGLKLKKYGLNIFVTDESKDRSTARIHIAKYENGSKYVKQDTSMIKAMKIKNNKLMVKTDIKYGDKLYAEYVGPNNKKEQLILSYKDGVYEADARKITDPRWILNYLIIMDTEENAKCVYNKDFYKIFGGDFAAIGQKEDIKQDTKKDIKKEDKKKDSNQDIKKDTKKKNIKQDIKKQDIKKQEVGDKGKVQEKSELTSKESNLPKTGEDIYKHIGFFTFGFSVVALGLKLKKKH